jgi:N-acetyl-gamma-glutamyl-phosphate reductase
MLVEGRERRGEDKMIRTGIIGVTGYTGMELARILLRHPAASLSFVSSRKWAGRKLAEALPQLAGRTSLTVSAFDPKAAAREAEVFFLCLPHGGAMDAAAALLAEGRKVVDLSADFRLRDAADFERWYQTPHRHPLLLERAVTGFCELHREEIAGADIVANPGCYPTSVVLGLAPLLEKGLAEPERIIVDSKSGVSGAGREPAGHLHFPEVEGDFSAYKVAGSHRHIAEMEQECARLAGKAVRVTFTPHLLPVSRGILSTIYAEPAGPLLTQEELDGFFSARYSGEPFVRVRGARDQLPRLKEARGTNMCLLAPRVDRRAGRYLVISCIDNLVKGAAGQAVQNMNLMCALPEDAGLSDLPLLP